MWILMCNLTLAETVWDFFRELLGTMDRCPLVVPFHPFTGEFLMSKAHRMDKVFLVETCVYMPMTMTIS